MKTWYQLIVFTVIFIGLGCGPPPAPTIQVELGFRSAQLISKDELEFKDLNSNNALDPYEDWRLSVEDRSKDLLSKMSIEQKVGLMLISTTRLENDWSFGRPMNEEPINSGFNETDAVSPVNFFTRKPLDYPTMSAAGTTKDVTEYHKRHFILRANPSAKILAEWNNNLQALCEKDGLGIPATITSNPRNHITSSAAIGLSVGKTPFSQWPGELGLSATRDLQLIRNFADIARKEWLSVGIRKGYMYMADLATEPRWQRVEGTFGENAEWVADIMEELVLGFQGEELSNTSIALTTKHFPGGGATEDGHDPHFEWGKREVFEAGMFENNLIPFKAAIAAGSASIMPYYSYPVHTQYPEVAYAFNKEVITNLLREELGFEGIINSDTGPIDMMPWGVETLSIIDRYKMALEAGINIFSGTADPTKLKEAIQTYPELMSLVDDSVYRLLLEKFRLGLFENPYVDIETAQQTVGKEEFQEQADLAQRKSIVLLRNEAENESPILPLHSKTKVYFELHTPADKDNPIRSFTPTETNVDIEWVEESKAADVVLLWIFPKGQSLFESSSDPVHVNVGANGIDIDHINTLTHSKPTILVVNYSSPWSIDEIYNEQTENIRAVLATFGIAPEALIDVLTGTFSPTGKMPFSTPLSDTQAQQQKSDLPGYLEPEGYALFHYDEGLTY